MKIIDRFLRFHRKTWRYLLSFIGIFLGFSTQVVAQYGVIETTYKIKGNITSAECMIPLKNIQVTLKEGRGNDEQRNYRNTVLTDDKGEFNLHLTALYGNDSLKFELADTDGSLNGLYRDTVFVIPLADEKFKQVSGGHWTRHFEYSVPLQMQAVYSGLPPCNENDSDDSVSVYPANYKDTAKAILPADTMASEVAASSPEYSENIAGIMELKVYPNPVSGLLKAAVSNPGNATDAILFVYDGNLRVVFRKEIRIELGDNLYEITTETFAPGSFFVVIQANESIISRQVIHLDAGR